MCRGIKEKHGRQSPKGISASGWSGKPCLTPFRRTNGGDCLIADNSLYLPRRTCYDARNTECCMPDSFSTNPTLSPRQTAVIEAVRKEWHREKLACCLLVTPLPYHSLRLAQEYVTAIKGQPNNEAVCRGEVGGQWTYRKKKEIVTKMDLVTKRHIIAKEKVTKTYKNVKFLPISLVVTE